MEVSRYSTTTNANLSQCYAELNRFLAREENGGRVPLSVQIIRERQFDHMLCDTYSVEYVVVWARHNTGDQ